MFSAGVDGFYRKVAELNLEIVNLKEENEKLKESIRYVLEMERLGNPFPTLRLKDALEGKND